MRDLIDGHFAPDPNTIAKRLERDHAASLMRIHRCGYATTVKSGKSRKGLIWKSHQRIDGEISVSHLDALHKSGLLTENADPKDREIVAYYVSSLGGSVVAVIPHHHKRKAGANA